MLTWRNELRPGDIGTIIRQHGVIYAVEQGWNHTFEAYVAGPLAQFALKDSPRERIWLVERADEFAGSVAIVKHTEEQAQLRWLLVHPDVRGRGLGRQLVERALQFAGDCGYRSVILWTVSTLESAAALYRSFDFQVDERKQSHLWGGVVTEERYIRNLDATAGVVGS